MNIINEDISCLIRMLKLKSTGGSTVELARRCRIMYVTTIIISILIIIFVGK